VHRVVLRLLMPDQHPDQPASGRAEATRSAAALADIDLQLAEIAKHRSEPRARHCGDVLTAKRSSNDATRGTR
jgi:hypothetical protein